MGSCDGEGGLALLWLLLPEGTVIALNVLADHRGTAATAAGAAAAAISINV